MSLTQQDGHWFDKRSSLTTEQTATVNAAFEAVTQSLKLDGIQPAMDDRAAALEGALIRYMLESTR
jgi:hypothetical protein